nr:hypothetical protein [Pseudomonadota bacterium]
MQNQLFRGLFISLFALTLTACVGAVNIGGTNPQATLINRCIVGNTAQSDPTCAKAVADTNGCITNPFLSGCEANPVFSRHVQNARDERVKFCNDANNEEDSLCTGSDSEKDICTHDPFGRVCDGLYYQERKLICEDALTFPRCADIVSSVCRTDPFNTNLCFGDDTYNSERERKCRHNSNLNPCTNTISRVCGADPFNTTLCFQNADYNDVRERTCKNEPNSERCTSTLSRICGVNAFDTFCDGSTIYLSNRRTTCTNEPNSERCSPMVLQICTADSLDPLCNGLTKYFSAQEKACRSEPNSPRCHATLDRVCGADVFGVLCQSSYLTLRDIPVLASGYFGQKSDDAPSGSCVFSRVSYSCSARFPNAINIKPLNNANSGTATYTGSVSLKYRYKTVHGNSRDAFFDNDSSISLVVDFDNNRISYSGGLGSSFHPFNINGNFTDRGQITGTVDFKIPL